MIQFLRRHTINSMKNVFASKKPFSLRSQSGQIGIVLILLAAFGLLFYAVALNFGKASDLKTRTLIAAESSAALTSSYLAGTAEKLSQEHLKGEAGYCDSSSWLEAVFKIILLVIVIIIAIIINIIPGVGSLISALLWAVVIGAILAIVFTTISIILQITIVQPGITSMWNEMMAKSFEKFEDQVLEQGVQISLQKIIDDPIELPDVLDFDNDGVFAVVSSGVINGAIADTYARFAHYNTLRLQGAVSSKFNPAYMDEFLARLRGLLFLNDTDTGTMATPPRIWGLFDETAMSSGVCPNGAAICDPCCLPLPDACCASCLGENEACCTAAEQATCGLPGEASCCLVPVKPLCCNVAACTTQEQRSTCGYPRPLTCGPTYPNHCYQHSFLYQDQNGNAADYDAAYGQPFIYDPYYEDARNNTDPKYISFREWLGRDDVSDAFRVTVDEVTPAYPVKWHTLTLPDDRQEVVGGVGVTVAAALTNRFALVPVPPDMISGLEQRFRPQDSSGFYSQDDQAGQFPLFYKIRDQISLELPVLASALIPYPNHLRCMWWNRTHTPCAAGVLPDPAQQFVLTYTLAETVKYGGVVPAFNVLDDVLSPLLYTDYAGDNTFKDMGFYTAPDTVGNEGLERLFAGEDICAEVAARPLEVNATNMAVGSSALQNIQSNVRFPGFKPGADFYCSEDYPYESGCRKHDPGRCIKTMTFQRIVDGVTPLTWETYSQNFPVDCSCGETAGAHPSKWPDDILDVFYRKINELVALTNELSGLQARGLLVTTFVDWYDKVADWIEPAYNKAACVNPTDRACLETYTKKERWGHLWVFREEFREIYQIFDAWLNNLNASGVLIKYQGGNCFDAWCLPSPACPMLSAEEKLGYDIPTGGPPAVKDGFYTAADDGLEAVLQCMDWAGAPTTIVKSKEVPGTDLRDSGGNLYTGVKGYYQACLDHCGTAYCDALPRPFVPDYEVLTSRPRDADWRMPTADLALGTYRTCLRSITVDQCRAATAAVGECSDAPGYDAPSGQVFAGGPGYSAFITSWFTGCPNPPGAFVPTNVTCHDATTLSVTCATTRPEIDSCLRHLLDSCAWIVPGGDRTFYNALAMLTDCSPGNAAIGLREAPYRRWLKANIAVADHFVAKLVKRRQYLIGVRDEITAARDGFKEIYNRLTEFLDNATVFGTSAAVAVPPQHGCSAAMSNQIPAVPTGYAGTNIAAYYRLDSLFTTGMGCQVRFPYSNRTEVYSGVSFTGTDQDSPSEMLIDARAMERSELDVDYEGSGLPAFAIYVWRGDADKDPDWFDGTSVVNQGLIHAVKVDARLPRRCKNMCDFTGTGPNDWPTIDTYSTGFLNSTRCFELRNHFGMTKARVIRFDQSPNVSKLKLFNKIPFVLPNFSHPDVGTGKNITGGNVFTVCAAQIDTLITTLIANNPAIWPALPPGQLHKEAQAFMINWPPKNPAVTAAEQADLACWDYVHTQLLGYGVVSHSCANYYWGGPGGAAYGKQGMRVKFAPCNRTFIEDGDF